MFPLTLAALVPILITLLVVGLVIYAVYWLLDTLALPGNIKQLAKVIIAIIALIYILQLFVR
jgi:hypothetical protein